MRDPRDVIIGALRYDHDNTANAERILAALLVEGHEIVPSERVIGELRPAGPARLREIQRVYADG